MKKSSQSLVVAATEGNSDLISNIQEQLKNIRRGLAKTSKIEIATKTLGLGGILAATYTQPILAFTLLSSLLSELNILRQRGIVQIIETKDVDDIQSLNFILRELDSGVIDKRRFNAIKSLFFCSLEITAPEGEKLLARQFMKLANRLSSEELLVLRAAYQIAVVDQNSDPSRSVELWRAKIAAKISHNLPELIEVTEDVLIRERLISIYVYADKSAYKKTPYFRLTDTGYRFCQLVLKYDS